MARNSEVKIEVILDDKEKKFYPGDEVNGKIFITSNQNYSLKDLRLAWTGRIQVQPIQTNKAFQIYFDECWKLGPKISKASNKTLKGSTQVTYYNTQLISVTEYDIQEPKVDLPKNKTIGFTFKVNVPNDRPLPSSTSGSSNNKIIYLLEAFIAKNDEKPTVFGQRTVPVLEAIYTRTEEMMKPQRAEQVFNVLLTNQNIETRSAMRVTLPCRGCQTGVAIPVSISIWNNIEFSRKQGISISLFRVNQIMANGRAYTSAGEKVHRIVADLNITPDEKEDNQLVQTIRAALPIPKGTTPTITLEKSGLLSISYYIRVQVFAQEGTYITPDGIKSQFMLVDIPFVVGTLTTPPENNTTKSNHTTPLSSPRSLNNGMIVSPTTSSVIFTEVYTDFSPRLRNSDTRNSSSNYPSTLTSGFIDMQQSTSSSTMANSATNGRTNPILSSTPITSPELTNKSVSVQQNNDLVASGNSDTTVSSTVTTSATLIDNNKKGTRMIGGMFRRSSSSSNNSLENGKKKKKNVFSSLKLYGRSNSGTSNVSKEEIITTTDKINAEEGKEDHQKEEIEKTEDQATLAVSNGGGGVFDIFSGDDENLSDGETVTPVANTTTAVAATTTGKVFNMFPDDDDDDEEEEENDKKKDDKPSGGVFNMFPDDDSDDEDDQDNNTLKSTKYPILGDGGIQQESSTTETNIEDPLTYENSSATNQRLLTSHVFKMFDDSDDDENDENDIQSLSISKNQEQQKPNEKEEEIYQKPHTIEDTMNDNQQQDSDENSSDDDDAFDLLGALARKEKLQRRIA